MTRPVRLTREERLRLHVAGHDFPDPRDHELRLRGGTLAKRQLRARNDLTKRRRIRAAIADLLRGA